MEQPVHILENGTRVKTCSKLEALGLAFANQSQVALRKPNQSGIITGVVGGCGGDVYWVRHDTEEDEVSPYGFWEFELE